jgi:hypothetical protein
MTRPARYASTPIGVPARTSEWVVSRRPSRRLARHVSAVSRQYRHQQDPGSPGRSNRSTRSGQRSAVSGWNSSGAPLTSPAPVAAPGISSAAGARSV